MSEAKPLKCQKCGNPLSYVNVMSKSFLVARSSVDNLKLFATCTIAPTQIGFIGEAFNMPLAFQQ
jgi:hypothetical protein